MLNHATSKSESNTALHIQRQYIQAFQAAQSQQVIIFNPDLRRWPRSVGKSSENTPENPSSLFTDNLFWSFYILTSIKIYVNWGSISYYSLSHKLVSVMNFFKFNSHSTKNPPTWQAKYIDKRGCVCPNRTVRWSFCPHSAWGSIELKTILTTHPSL